MEEQILVKNQQPRKNPERRINTVFITVMLLIPVLHWIVFWFIVNINSILMAFKIPTGDWSLESLRIVFRDLKAGDSTLRIAIKNTLLYFYNSNFIHHIDYSPDGCQSFKSKL